MSSLITLFGLHEMARHREEPTWAVLDWAAQQPGSFTIKDLYKVYQTAGGEQGYTSFHTTIGKLTAKPWKDDQEKYALSDKRPFVVDKRGSRGAGGATFLKWGLDRPLREPQGAPEAGESDENSAIGDALDRLEAMMGGPKLKAAIARWKRMPSIHAAVVDIRASVPTKGQMDALHVASEYLMNKGKANADDVDDAESEIEYTKPKGPDTSDDDPPADDDTVWNDDEETGGSFSSRPDDDEGGGEDAETDAAFGSSAVEPDDIEPEPDEEEPVAAATPTPASKGPETKQAGAANFLGGPKPEPPKEPEPPKKSPLSKFFKRK